MNIYIYIHTYIHMINHHPLNVFGLQVLPRDALRPVGRSVAAVGIQPPWRDDLEKVGRWELLGFSQVNMIDISYRFKFIPT
jgi:hypothetical protein